MAKIGGHSDKPARNVQKIKANLCREEIATAAVFWKLRKLKRSHVVHACQREPAENHLGNLLPNVPDPWPHWLHSWKVLTLWATARMDFFDVTSVLYTDLPTCQPTHITCMLTSVPTSTFCCAQYSYRMYISLHASICFVTLVSLLHDTILQHPHCYTDCTRYAFWGKHFWISWEAAILTWLLPSENSPMP